MAARMIQSYHEGCSLTRHDEQDQFDRTSLREQGPRRANCLNPLQLFSWMHKKIVSSFSLGKTHDSSATKSTRSKQKTRQVPPSRQTQCDVIEMERRDSGVYSTLDHVRHTDPHYCTVLFGAERDASEDFRDDIIEPTYEDCPVSFNELSLPCTKYHSQLSQTSNATSSTQHTTTTGTSGLSSSFSDASNHDTSTDRCQFSASSNACVRKSVSVTNDWLAPSTIYSKVMPRTFDHRPPPLPSQRLYRQAEVEALLHYEPDQELTVNSTHFSETSGQLASARQHAVVNDELENIYESIDKINALPTSESVYSLTRGKLSGWRSRLQQEIEGLRFIDSPSESLLSLDTRTGRIHGLLNPLSRFSGSRRLLVESVDLKVTQAAML